MKYTEPKITYSIFDEDIVTSASGKTSLEVVQGQIEGDYTGVKVEVMQKDWE